MPILFDPPLRFICFVLTGNFSCGRQSLEKF